MRLPAAGALIGLLVIAASQALAQVPCARHEFAFACADGTSLAIHDDPWGMTGSRGRRGGMGRGSGPDSFATGCDGRACGWWKDDRNVYGPDGEVCVLHGTHVHCSGAISDP